MSAEQPLPVVRSVGNQVYEALQARVLDMKFTPGERLVIDKLARELGVSATPVRDALGRMAAEHLIAFEPYRGFTVLGDPTAEEVEESFEARRGIEMYAARLGAGRATDAQIAEMREVDAQIASRNYEGKFDSYVNFVRSNRRFHELIVATSSNRFLVEANRNLYHDMLLARTMHDRGVPDLTQIGREHRAIIEGFENRDPDEVEQAVSRHILDGAARIRSARVVS